MHHHKKKKIGFIFDGLPIELFLGRSCKYSFKYWQKYFSKVCGFHRDEEMASTRLRVYDVINFFKNSKEFLLEVYRPWKNYNIVIFQKKFDKSSYALAKKLHGTGTKIILDINVNFYDKSSIAPEYLFQYDDIIKFSKLCSAIITTSEYLKCYIEEIFHEKKIFCIEENINDNFFSVKKKIAYQLEKIKFVYSGYACKAQEILLIKKHLEKLSGKYVIEYLFICEKDPGIEIKGIESKFIKYQQKQIPKDLLLGDIFLAPRNLENAYNLGHSFQKIGCPMALGIPVIASPVPSYKNSPAILINGFGDAWFLEIERLADKPEYYKKISNVGVEYCKKNYSIEKIAGEYIKIFNYLEG